MPIFQVGNMWDAFDKADHFIVVTSATTDASGRLIMNRGMAAEVQDRYADASQALGKHVLAKRNEHGIFGCIAIGKVGVLQDRYTHNEELNLHCVSTATTMLKWLAEEQPQKKFHVEMAGQDQHWWLMKGCYEKLPQNVVLWSKP